MEKKLVYQSPIAITEILADEDILTGSLTVANDDVIFKFDNAVGWKEA